MVKRLGRARRDDPLPFLVFYLLVPMSMMIVSLHLDHLEDLSEEHGDANEIISK